MKKYKLLVTYKREIAEIKEESLFHEEDGYNPCYLEMKGYMMSICNDELQYTVYEL